MPTQRNQRNQRNQRHQRQTQKKVKGGWLWCETVPLKYISPCKAEEVAAERLREAQQIEKAARAKEIAMKTKELEAQKKTMDAQMDAQITALKTPAKQWKLWGTTDTVTPKPWWKIWGGRRNNRSQKRKKSTKK